MTKPAHLFAFVFAIGVSCGGSPKQAALPDDGKDTDEPRSDADDVEEDDGLQLEGTKGKLDPHDAQPVLEASWDKLAACWQIKATKQRWLGGHLELKFRVNLDGTVKQVYVYQSDLGSWPVEKCLIATAGALQFPEPTGGEAEITFPIDFPNQARFKQLDEEGGAAELGAKLGELSDCAPTPMGVHVTVYVGAGGKVTSAGFAAGDSEPFDDAWGDCALEKAMAWTLTDPRGTVTKATAAYVP